MSLRTVPMQAWAWLAALALVGCVRSPLETDLGETMVPVEEPPEAGPPPSFDASQPPVSEDDAGPPAPRVGAGCSQTLICTLSCLGVDLGPLLGGGGGGLFGGGLFGGGLFGGGGPEPMPMEPLDTSNPVTCLPECLGRACEEAIPPLVESVGCVVGSGLEGLIAGGAAGAGGAQPNPLTLFTRCGQPINACLPQTCSTPPIEDLQGGLLGTFLNGLLSSLAPPDGGVPPPPPFFGGGAAGQPGLFGGGAAGQPGFFGGGAAGEPGFFGGGGWPPPGFFGGGNTGGQGGNSGGQGGESGGQGGETGGEGGQSGGQGGETGGEGGQSGGEAGSAAGDSGGAIGDAGTTPEPALDAGPSVPFDAGPSPVDASNDAEAGALD